MLKLKLKLMLKLKLKLKNKIKIEINIEIKIKRWLWLWSRKVGCRHQPGSLVGSDDDNQYHRHYPLDWLAEQRLEEELSGMVEARFLGMSCMRGWFYNHPK